jgi:hypothetical protein
VLYPLNTRYWEESFSTDEQQSATLALEEGKVIFLPELAFQLKAYEESLLTPAILEKKYKNVSFNPNTQAIKGVADKQNEYQLRMLMDRFFMQSYAFVEALMPHYKGKLIKGRTSYRPVEVAGRKTSILKDDTRLHVDAFVATPNQGKRILRVFCNINPEGQSRLWHLGEPFEAVAAQFLKDLRSPVFGSRALLRLLGITKSYRSLYDHYMLTLHNEMKKNEEYQKNVPKESVHFPANSTWIVMTDSVSHAALSGQFMLEQTFYLPVENMLFSERSPKVILEKALGL